MAGGTTTGQTEDEVVEAIKDLAVREENAMVARVKLYDIRQDRDPCLRGLTLWPGSSLQVHHSVHWMQSTGELHRRNPAGCALLWVGRPRHTTGPIERQEPRT